MMDDLISRQAVIDGFYEMASDIDHLCTVSDYVHFLETMSSAQSELAQDLLNACTDAISRQTVIDAVNAYLMLSQISRTIQDSISLQEIIEHVPAVQPERKKGKWIFLDECSNSGYYCSECNKKVVKEGWSNTVKKINFCPNCGADMRGE